GLRIQSAETAVAVGLERTHLTRIGQGEGLLVVYFGGRSVWRVTLYGNLAEQPQGPCLIAPHFVGAGVREPTLGQPVSLLHILGEEIGLPTDDGVPLDLPQHGEGVRRAASQGVGERQILGSAAVIEWAVG